MGVTAKTTVIRHTSQKLFLVLVFHLLTIAIRPTTSQNCGVPSLIKVKARDDLIESLDTGQELVKIEARNVKGIAGVIKNPMEFAVPNLEKSEPPYLSLKVWKPLWDGNKGRQNESQKSYIDFKRDKNVEIDVNLTCNDGNHKKVTFSIPIIDENTEKPRFNEPEVGYHLTTEPCFTGRCTMIFETDIIVIDEDRDEENALFEVESDLDKIEIIADFDTVDNWYEEDNSSNFKLKKGYQKRIRLSYTPVRGQWMPNCRINFTLTVRNRVNYVDGSRPEAKAKVYITFQEKPGRILPPIFSSSFYHAQAKRKGELLMMEPTNIYASVPWNDSSTISYGVVEGGKKYIEIDPHTGAVQFVGNPDELKPRGSRTIIPFKNVALPFVIEARKWKEIDGVEHEAAANASLTIFVWTDEPTCPPVECETTPWPGICPFPTCPDPEPCPGTSTRPPITIPTDPPVPPITSSPPTIPSSTSTISPPSTTASLPSTTSPTTTTSQTPITSATTITTSTTPSTTDPGSSTTSPPDETHPTTPENTETLPPTTTEFSETEASHLPSTPVEPTEQPTSPPEESTITTPSNPPIGTSTFHPNSTVSTSTTELPTSPPSECPCDCDEFTCANPQIPPSANYTRFSLYPDPFECTRFHSCPRDPGNDWRSFYCEVGLVFCPTNSQCTTVDECLKLTRQLVYPFNIKGYGYGPGPRSSEEMGGDPCELACTCKVGIPPWDPRNLCNHENHEQHIPDPEYCDIFHQCQPTGRGDYVDYPKKCNAGLIFCPYYETCVRVGVYNECRDVCPPTKTFRQCDTCVMGSWKDFDIFLKKFTNIRIQPITVASHKLNGK